MSIDKETAKYLAEVSRGMIDRQVGGYRERKNISSTIIGLNTLFIPFFLSGLSDSEMWIKAIAIIPMILISVALYYLLKIYYLNPLERGLAVSMYEETIAKSYDDAILKEISVNRDSYLSNNQTLIAVNKSYRLGIDLTKMAIGISILVLSLNLFFRPVPEKIKVEITNIQALSNGPKK